MMHFLVSCHGRARTASVIGIGLLCLSGCQVANPNLSTRDISERLARLEARRLADDSPDRRLDVPPRALALTSSPVIGPASTGTHRAVVGRGGAGAGEFDWSHSLCLTDLGSDDDPRAADLKLADREERYLRRPPLDSLWETVKRDVKNAPADLWHDTKRVYGNPVNLVILGVTYGGALAIQETGPDDTIEHHYGPGRHSMSSEWRHTFDAVGNPFAHFAMAGAWYLLGQQTSSDKTYEVGKTMFSALIINGLTVVAGQAASYDDAPNGIYGTFPSGHTSSSFVMASVLHEAYGHAVGIPLYGVAALVAAQRIDDREHYFSDVVMGGVLGLVVGHSVASGRDPEFFGWKIAPFASPASGATGIAFVKDLP